MDKIWSNLIRNIQPPRVVTIIGGGGKTSLMYYLLTVLKAGGFNAVGTTTTKLSSQPLSGNFVQVASVEEAYKAVQQARGIQDHVTLVSSEEGNNITGKMVGIPGEWIDDLASRCRDVVFVVEGDGSAGKSLKGHLGHEPVIPSSSSLVIPVIGIDSMEARLNSQNVHRPARICELTGAIPGSLITTKMISQLLFHPQGYLRNCSEHNLIVPLINKVESVVQGQQAEELGREILANKHPQVGGVIVGSLRQEEGLWLQV